MKISKVLIDTQWDSDAGVWIATSAQVPELVVEAASLDEVASEVKALLPQLFELRANDARRAATAVDMQLRHQASA